jgi:hypothetical protein
MPTSKRFWKHTNWPSRILAAYFAYGELAISALM